MSKQAQRFRRIGDSRATIRAKLNGRDAQRYAVRFAVR